MSICFVNNTDLITSDQKVNADEVKIVLEKLLGVEWQPFLPNIIETCKGWIDNSTHNGSWPNGPNSPTSNCDRTNEKLFYCLRQQFLQNCPASAWKNGKGLSIFRRT